MTVPHDEPAARINRSLLDLLAEAGPAERALAARLGIGVTDARALQHLAVASTPTGTVELGNRLHIRSASAAVLVDRLENSGHLQRRPHPTDRRRVRLAVTGSAQEQVRTALRPLLQHISALIDQLGPDQATTIADFLGDVVTALRGYSDETDRDVT
ncbi:MarR family transcriptional regulator [Amycolatopsis sp. NPDC089917]|uniref:MarR family winged helix-turn-helix transcriptional regulator n=1 Tax=Amycolatopsis sp. NPDC089917 TaxID=3155187 RepID=UPI0034264322